MHNYFFISGLPRSGSTLLSAILKQNPTIYADIASPIHAMMKASLFTLTTSENNFNVDEIQRKNMLHGMIEGYYHNIDRKNIFDSCRAWTASTNLLKELFPNTKIICCVRDINWILDSFEKIYSKNSLYFNTSFDNESVQSVFTRCDSHMDVKKHGTVIKPMYHLMEGLAANPEMIMLVEYTDLCKTPEELMIKIYKFLELPNFKHDFNNVEYKNEIFDSALNLKDLHTVKTKVEYKERPIILPKSIWDKYSNKEFWREKKVELNYG
jgi:sulfotransferase